jgi:two-component system nitrogen regulation sensor histidine kinase NtrY
MQSLSFRKRILLALLLLGAVPTSLGILGWGLALRNTSPAIAGRVAFEEVGASARDFLRVLDTAKLSVDERRALTEHTVTLNDALARSQRAEAFSQMKAYGITVVIVVLGSLLVFLSVIIGRSLSRQLSAPIDELVGWTGHIRRGEPLPATERKRGAPEFASLRSALRNMATEIRLARSAELEAERLRAFREIARRVAHEMKNPLTPVRFAVRQLQQTATSEQHEALDVLTAESGRLEQLAREFATLGRLPEGPSAEVDLGELLGELLRTSVPATVRTAMVVAPGTPPILGHYDPLRRAFGNLIRNAVESMGGGGLLEVRIGVADDRWVVVELVDHGPGIPAEKRDRVFEPYYTEKAEGTGLGLPIVKQAVDLHRGVISVRDTPGGGATFEVRFPLPAGEPGA